MFIGDEGVLLSQVDLSVLGLRVLHVQEAIMHLHGFFHDLSDSIHALVVHRLVIMRGLIHSEVVEHVGVIALIDEELVAVLLDDYIPGVEGLGGSHDSCGGYFGGKDISFVLLGKATDHGIFKSGHVIVDLSSKIWNWDLLVGA